MRMDTLLAHAGVLATKRDVPSPILMPDGVYVNGTASDLLVAGNPARHSRPLICAATVPIPAVWSPLQIQYPLSQWCFADRRRYAANSVWCSRPKASNTR